MHTCAHAGVHMETHTHTHTQAHIHTHSLVCSFAHSHADERKAWFPFTCHCQSKAPTNMYLGDFFSSDNTYL